MTRVYQCVLDYKSLCVAVKDEDKIMLPLLQSSQTAQTIQQAVTQDSNEKSDTARV